MSEVEGCLACEGTLEEGPGHGWLRCTSCRSWRRADLPSPDRHLAAHEELYFAGDGSVEMTADGLLEQYLDELDRVVPLTGRRILDVGAGVASTPRLLARRGGRYAAVESSPAARQQLTDLGAVAYADLTSAAGDGPFDAALLIEIVEHLLDPVPFLVELRRCLTDGAHVYVATPNASSLHGRLRGGHWWAATNPTHVALFTPGGLERLLARAGLTVAHRHRRVDYGRGGWHGAAQSLLQRGGHDGGLRVIARPRQDLSAT